MIEYVCDTETTYIEKEETTRIYLWCTVGVDDATDRSHGYDIDSMIQYFSKKSHIRILYHNLKYDGSYILNYLLSNGYKFTRKNNLSKGEFNAIISDMRQFYSVKIRFKNGNLVTIWDSYKILTSSVKQLAKSFKLPFEKEKIDHINNRPIDMPVSEQELHYCYRDCEIVCECIKYARSEGMDKMTAGSCSLNIYKNMIGGEKKFRAIFPILSKSVDSFLRMAYRGGFVWVHPERQNVEVWHGSVYDVNSMYPWAMREKPLPYGHPEAFEGAPKKKTLWIARIYIGKAIVKQNHIPTIQIKGSRFTDTEYLTEIEDAAFTITNVDWGLIQEHYDLYDVSWYNGFYFESAIGLFNEFIDHFMEIKANSAGALRYLAKLMLNSLYGKFGVNPERFSLDPYIDEGILRFRIGEEKEIEPCYTALATFVTSYARQNIITAGQKEYDRLCYIDTDSIHIIGDKIPDINISDSKLGYYKEESRFDFARYIRPKTYIEVYNGQKTIKCAGMPEDIKAKLKYSDFVPGATFEGKLQLTQVKGGCVLLPRPFTIKILQ